MSSLPLKERLYLKWRYSHLANWLYERRNRRQRAKKGYSDFDVSGMDIWFMNIIPKMLRDFRKSMQAYPELFTEEWFENNKEECEKYDYDINAFYCNTRCDEDAERLSREINNYNLRKWEETLDRMIFLFEETNEEMCSKKNPYIEEYYGQFVPDWALSRKELRDRKKNPPPPRDEEAFEKLGKLCIEEDNKIEEYRKQCEKEAFEMFFKYLHNLWY